MSLHFLEPLFSPRGVAVYGASDNRESVAGLVLRNLIEGGYPGRIVPINPKYTELSGLPCYADLNSSGTSVDLAIIATPASTVPDILRSCGQHEVHAAIILTAGFAESGKPNKFQREVVKIADEYGIRFLGPNCLGLVRPKSHLNASFSIHHARSGSLALVSQSGAVCAAILDWVSGRHMGLSAVVSLGDATNIDFGSVLNYLALDSETKAIILYIEGVKNARSFVSGLRSVARIKPVVAMKVGRHMASAQAALSHTGSLVGADDVFDAALQRAGVVRVQSIDELFAAAELLANRHRVSGNRLVIVTNGGGPGIIATDRTLDLGIEMAQLTQASLEKLEAIMPQNWSHGNPVDLLGDADPKRYQGAVEICLHDPNVDGVLVLLTPLAMTHPEEVAKQLVGMTIPDNKIVFTCWMGFEQIESSRQLFATHAMPTFMTPENAVEAFSFLVDYHRNQQLLLQAPGPLQSRNEPDVEGARLIIEAALAEGRSLLSRAEVNAVLSAFSIPVMPVSECRSGNEALVAAESVGFPIAMKINSPDITHKTDVDGVRLNISNANSVRSAFNQLMDAVKQHRPEAKIDGVTVERMYSKPNSRELMAGVIRDPVFGPVITFGAGGTMLEFIRDRATALPPLNANIIENLICRTRVAKLLGQFRNQPPVDHQAIVRILQRLSDLVVELPHIRELDINPFVVNEEGATVLDARIVVDSPYMRTEQYGHMAIHPYPADLVFQHQLADGSDLVIRPIRPEDADIEQAFVNGLSEQSKRFRFMHVINEMTPQMLSHFTQIEYDRDMALIAVSKADGEEREIGVARYSRNPDGTSCEFALVIDDLWNHKGIGTLLMRRLIEVARRHRLQIMEGEVLSDNHPMLTLTRNLGFEQTTDPDDPTVVQISKVL